MKQHIFTIAKTAMKHFFDIDPVITEHFMLQTAEHARLIQQEAKQAIQLNLHQGKTRIVSHIHLHTARNWNAA